MQKNILCLIFICFSTIAWCQESQQEKLQLRKAQIQNEIKNNEKQLQFVKKKESTAVKIIVLQEEKIKLKETLILTTQHQEKILSKDIFANQNQIDKLDKELQLLKADYAKMIVMSYRSRSEESRTMFILSSDNFLQAYKRAQYIKQYTSFRKKQGLEIKLKSEELLDFNKKLKYKKSEKQKLIVENVEEQLSLESAKLAQEKLILSIAKDKNKIVNKIKKKQFESRSIDRKIDQLIREAIAEANRKAAKVRAAKEKARLIAHAKAVAAQKARELEKLKAIENAKLLAIELAKAKERERIAKIASEKAAAKALAAEKAAAIAKATAQVNATAEAKEKAKSIAIAAANAKASAASKASAAANAKATAKEATVKATAAKETAKRMEKATSIPIVPAPEVSSSEIVLSSSGKKDSDNFKANKGRLPKPVENGFISLKFGNQPHPVYKSLTIHNSGLEFTTDPGSSARAVFAGVVASVIVLSPINKAVVLQHGDFFTVYQNLSSTNVSKGDKVNIKQGLGKIRTNGEGRTILKFTLSQNTVYTNPLIWLVN
jgi:septal ring factor EnvC (AmiA/AmiB activator)